MIDSFRAVLAGVLVTLALQTPAPAHAGTFRGATQQLESGVPGGSGASATAGVADTDVGSWTYWWSFNRDRYLSLKAAVRGEQSVTGADDFYLGRRTLAQPKADWLPTNETIRTEVTPALLEILEREEHKDILSATLLALAKIGSERAGSESHLAARIQPFLRHPNQEVRESAVIALGVLADPSSSAVLGELVHDTRTGRRLTGRSKVDYRTRSFAAFGLGLLGARTENDAIRRYVVHHLGRAIDSDVQPSPDLAIAGVIGMGLVLLDSDHAPVRMAEGEVRPSQSRQAQLRFLLDHFADHDLPDRVRTHIPLALARLDHGATPSLKAELTRVFVKALASSREPALVHQGLAQALGLLGDDDADAEDVAIRSALETAARGDDRLTRHLSLLALARASARPGMGPAGDAPRETRAYLTRMLARGNTAARGWAGLALGVFENAREAAGAPPTTSTRDALVAALESAKSPTEAGAYCIALGLAPDERAIEPLVQRALQGDENLRGYAATALGLMKAKQAVPALEDVVEHTRYRPGLLRESAIALALLENKDTVAQLVSRLERSADRAEQIAVAGALGFVGDARSVTPLLALLLGERHSETTRAYAAVALGGVCDKENFPWNAKLAADFSWWEAPATLLDPDSHIGVLDLF